MTRRIFTWLVIWLLSFSVMARGQEPEDTHTRAFDDHFRTIQWRVGDDDQIFPVISLAGDDRLTLTFDELTDERSYLRYELVHCDRNWQPDGLVESEFLDGFNEGEVEEYAFSRATLVHYVNYRITVPNERMRIIASGNYLLRVYAEDAPDTILLQARFCVNEGSMKVRADVTSRTDTDYNGSSQQISLSVDVDHVVVSDMWRDLSVSVVQNGRIDNVRHVVAPLRVEGGKAVYEHDRALIFPAGNEYRRFETVSTYYPSMGVEAVERRGPLYHMILSPDKPRAGRGYSYDSTQFGRYRVREYNSDDSDTEADYVAVHFTLESPELEGGDIFIDGDLVNRVFGPESRMVYNRASHAYELTLMLKQGSYNYEYLFVPYSSFTGSTARVEGDYYQTVNEYDIMVYHRVPGERYDRLVAIGTIFSGR